VDSRLRGNDKKTNISANQCTPVSNMNEVEKTKPIYRKANRRNIILNNGLWSFICFMTAKKQSQFKPNVNMGKIINNKLVPAKAGIQSI
jgi:hypothetical protein